MEETAKAKLPLDGIRVVDLTIWIQGPIAGMLLADMGAEVIKVEKPVSGDFSRGARSIYGRDILLPHGGSLMWEVVNRNKKDIALDLHTEKGKEALCRLVERSDVFLTNLHPAALREFGADQDTILKHNPQIIYARAAGFGTRGPDAEEPCQDTAGMARSGFMFNCDLPGEEPIYFTGALSDVFSGTTMAFGVLAALLARDRRGVTQAVYASQLSSMMWLQSFNIATYANLGYDFVPFDRKKVGNPFFNVYKCGDGKWLALGLYLTDRFWPDVCEVMGIKELEKDSRFDTEIHRKENCEELISILDRIFLTRPREEWDRLFRERQFWFSVVNRVEDLPTEPQVVANEYIVEFDNGLKMVSDPFELEKTKIPLKRQAPELGQHTEVVLNEACGYDWEEIAAMREQGVI